MLRVGNLRLLGLLTVGVLVVQYWIEIILIFRLFTVLCIVYFPCYSAIVATSHWFDHFIYFINVFLSTKVVVVLGVFLFFVVLVSSLIMVALYILLLNDKLAICRVTNTATRLVSFLATIYSSGVYWLNIDLEVVVEFSCVLVCNYIVRITVIAFVLEVTFLTTFMVARIIKASWIILWTKLSGIHFILLGSSANQIKLYFTRLKCG